MEEIIKSINWALIFPLIMIQGILLIVAVIDWAKNQENIRGNRYIWFFTIILLHIIGPILYFIFARRR